MRTNSHHHPVRYRLISRGFFVIFHVTFISKAAQGQYLFGHVVILSTLGLSLTQVTVGIESRAVGKHKHYQKAAHKMCVPLLLDPGKLLEPPPRRLPQLIVAAPTTRVRGLIDSGTLLAPLALAPVMLVQGGVVHVLAWRRALGRQHSMLLVTADRGSQGQAAECEEKTSAPQPATHEQQTASFSTLVAKRHGKTTKLESSASKLALGLGEVKHRKNTIPMFWHPRFF